MHVMVEFMSRDGNDPVPLQPFPQAKVDTSLQLPSHRSTNFLSFPLPACCHPTMDEI